jgi:hypothetical protein
MRKRRKKEKIEVIGRLYFFLVSYFGIDREREETSKFGSPSIYV